MGYIMSNQKKKAERRRQYNQYHREYYYTHKEQIKANQEKYWRRKLAAIDAEKAEGGANENA